MQKTRFLKSLSLIVCVVLMAAMALCVSGCNDNNPSGDNTQTTTTVGNTQSLVKGEGQTVFTFTVTDQNGNDTVYEIHTDKTTVGEALLDCSLIEGEEGPYGLYVKTVDGITLDYDKDGYYWSFYVNGEYAMSGVDTTEIAPNTAYAFKAEKA